MQNRSKDEPMAARGKTEEPEEIPNPNEQTSRVSHWMQSLLQMGLGEFMLRAATNVFSIIAILTVIWLAQMYFRQPAAKAQGNGQTSSGPTPMVAAPPAPPSSPADLSSFGILRPEDIHTNVPERARQDIVKYTVVAGDTIFDIAQKYGLQPETIFAANYYVLLDDPHSLQPGQELNILPVDGVYREWQAGEGLNGVAKFYGVTPEDIINYPGNKLDPNTIGDYAHPNIAPGTWIVVPGGKYQFHSPGSVPYGITRTDPASAQVLGPGYCDPVTGGAVGTGTFAWPAAKHYLSGFDYTPKINHFGIDIAGNLGEGVYATDGGVIVYAGWNNYGYGNMIMIDHGTGFQSLYAHLSEIYVGCGQSVNQSQAIGAIGSTGLSSGAHLHFEIRTLSNPVNPWDLLPPP